jgi:hypothetical protein
MAKGSSQETAAPVSIKQEELAHRSQELKRKRNILSHATVYLSGPMDFVASRAEAKKKGWRKRVGEFLEKLGTRVYDPWRKPNVVGMPHYGKEDEFSTKKRDNWTFEDSEAGDRTRAELGAEFWPTMHIDLRMVDTSDFLISYCPTNIYSVGTVHEIVMASLQHKPILFVSPPVTFPSLDELEKHLASQGDSRGQELLEQIETEAPLHPNPRAMPSMWYMALLDAHYFFDGFGFKRYMKPFGWEYGELDEREEEFPPKRPLLPYLENLNQKIPLRYDLEQDKYVENDDWLVFDPKELKE